MSDEAPAFKCGLCNDYASDSENSVLAHIQGKVDEAHKGWGRDNGRDHVVANDGSSAPSASSGRGPDSGGGGGSGSAGSAQPGQPDLPESKDDSEDDDSGGVTPPTECGHCGESGALRPMEDDIQLREDGCVTSHDHLRTVSLTEGDRVCTKCMSITEPDGTVHR